MKTQLGTENIEVSAKEPAATEKTIAAKPTVAKKPAAAKKTVTAKPAVAKKPEATKKTVTAKPAVAKKPEATKKTVTAKLAVAKKPEATKKTVTAKPAVAKKPAVTKKTVTAKPAAAKDKISFKNDMTKYVHSSMRTVTETGRAVANEFVRTNRSICLGYLDSVAQIKNCVPKKMHMVSRMSEEADRIARKWVEESAERTQETIDQMTRITDTGIKTVDNMLNASSSLLNFDRLMPLGNLADQINKTASRFNR